MQQRSWRRSSREYCKTCKDQAVAATSTGSKASCVSSQEDEHDAANGAKDGIIVLNSGSEKDGLDEKEATELAFRKGTQERSESGDSHLIDVDGVSVISDNSGTEDEADEGQGQRKATKNSNKHGWSGLPSWLRQWVSDGADMFKVHEPRYKRGAHCAASRDHLAAQSSLQ